MAVNTDETVIFRGDRKNRKQGILAIAAKAEANKPALINLQSVSGTTVTDRFLFVNDAGTGLQLHTAKPTTSASDGTTIGGVATLDAAFDATASPGKGIIDGAAATGAGNCLRVGGSATLDKIEFYHDGSAATIAAMADDLYLAAAGGDINFSGDNIAGAGSITGTSADIVTGELTCGSINRGAGTLTLEIGGTAEVSITSTATTLGGSLDVNTTGEVTCGSINRASGSLTLEIAGTAVATVTSSAVTLAQDLDVNTTGEVTAGSINRASGSLTLEIAGTAEQTITATETTLGGNLIMPSGGTITSAGTYVSFGSDDIITTGDIHIDADGTSSVGRLKLGDAGTSYIEDDGSTLNFYDTTCGPYTLNELATGTSLNPTVPSGSDFTITAGNFTWTNDATAETAVWTLAATAQDGIQIVSANTSADTLQITANDTAAGNLISLNADATMTTGCYVYCYDGSAQDFAVKLHGEVEIAGAANTDMLTVALGHVQVDSGKLEVDSSANDIGSHFITNESGQSTSTLLVHNNHATGTNKALEVIQDATGASTGIDLIHDGTGPALYVHPATARTGYGIHMSATNQEAEKLILIDGAATAASDEGTIEVSTTGVLAAGGNLLRVKNTGHQAAASFAVEIVNSGNAVNSTDGACLRIDHTGTTQSAGTTYAAWINATADRALKIAAGRSDILGDTYFGIAGTGVDVYLYGDNSGKHTWWDMDGNTDGELIFINTSILFDQTNCDYRLDADSDALSLIEVNDHASGAFTIGASGGSEGLDLIWQPVTSGDHVKFDAGTDACTFTDVPLTLAGADSSGTLLALTGIDTTGDSDTVTINHSGDGAAIKITTTIATSQGLEIVTATDSDVSQILVDGVTGNWVGDNDVGMVHLTSDGTLAHADASLLQILHTGAVAASARGACLRMVDTSANQSDSWMAYMSTTNNDGLLINTGAVADINLKLTGLDAQVGQMLHIDGTGGSTGWDGVNDMGCLHVNTLVLNNAGATGLFVDHAGQPISAAEGACARFIQSTGAAQTNSFLVEIEAITTGGALHVDCGHAVFDESVTVAGGYFSKFTTATTDTTDGANTWTAAEMLGGMLIRSGMTVGTKTDVTPTATALVAAIPGCVTGSSFEFFCANVDDDQSIILDGGADVTTSPGDTTIPINETAHFLMVITNAASPAATLYCLSVGAHS